MRISHGRLDPPSAYHASRPLGIGRLGFVTEGFLDGADVVGLAIACESTRGGWHRFGKLPPTAFGAGRAGAQLVAQLSDSRFHRFLPDRFDFSCIPH